MKSKEYTPTSSPIILDFTGCKTFKDLYDVISVPFNFPDYFGNNPDALWDCLSCYCRRELNVRIYGSKSIPDDLKNEFALILRVFNRVHEETPNITFEIVS